MSRDLDDRMLRDAEREPTWSPRRRTPLEVRGTLAVAHHRAQHGAGCECSWCVEQPATDAALDVLRKGGLL